MRAAYLLEAARLRVAELEAAMAASPRLPEAAASEEILAFPGARVEWTEGRGRNRGRRYFRAVIPGPVAVQGIEREEARCGPAGPEAVMVRGQPGLPTRRWYVWHELKKHFVPAVEADPGAAELAVRLFEAVGQSFDAFEDSYTAHLFAVVVRTLRGEESWRGVLFYHGAFWRAVWERTGLAPEELTKGALAARLG